jgi:hypothetical protein
MVESARLQGPDGGLNDLLGDLERYQGSLTQGLQKMLAMSQRIEHNTERLLTHIASTAAWSRVSDCGKIISCVFKQRKRKGWILNGIRILLSIRELE